MSPLCFPNYRLRKPETFIPMPKGCLFIPKTTSLPPSPAGIFLPHHIATELSHIANCGYSPLSGIYLLLCQERKPICPVTLKRHSYLLKHSLYQKALLHIICNLSERPRHSYIEQMTHSFTSVKGTAIGLLCDSPCDNSRISFQNYYFVVVFQSLDRKSVV